MRTADGYIVNKCLNGDSAAFGFLVDRYRSAVYALAYSKLRDFHDAEDVAQEVFIKAYRNLRSLRRYDNFYAWLYAITSNLCKDFIRARARRPDREFIEDQDPETTEALSMDAYREGLARESIHEALNSLPETYCQVLSLYYIGGMNSREIAEFLGTSPAAIRERLSRARSQLKEGMLAMMDKTFEEQKLPASFTFRIVEAIKRDKIHSMPRMTGLPWGLSLATGIIAAFMGISPYLNLPNPMDLSMSSSLPSETRVLKVGEIPVDMLKVSRIPFIASKQGNGNSGGHNLPNLQEALFLAPQGQGDTWTKKADMPIRECFSSNVVNGKIYVGGFDTMYEYDPATDKWTKKTDIPIPRAAFFSASVVDGKIYVIGGATQAPFAVISTVEEYDPKTDRWTKKADMSTPRMNFSTSVVNGKIYAIGGTSGGPKFSTVEEYDPKTDTWTRKADMPTARWGLSTSAVNGKIYAIGGSGGGGQNTEEYDPATDKWARKADMPTARWGLSTSVVNGKIYAIGGALNNDVSFATVEKYDPATDTWTKEADMPTARQVVITSAVNGKIYAFGGRRVWTQPIQTVEEYDTGFAGEGKSIETTGKLPTTWGREKGRGERETR